MFLELSRKHSGIFYAISNVGATVPGIVAPLATSVLLDAFDREGWVLSFGLGGAISLLACVPFALLFFGSSLEPLPCLDGAAAPEAEDLAAPLLEEDVAAGRRGSGREIMG